MMSEAFGFVDENGLRQVEALIMQNIDKVSWCVKWDQVFRCKETVSLLSI